MAGAAPDAIDSLTPREREILALLREGLTNAQIAQRLDISVDGAKYHVSQIIGKLGVRNRYEASVWPEHPPWWMRGLSPLALLFGGRRSGRGLGVAATALVVLLLVVVVGGVGLMVLLLNRDGGGNHVLVVYSQLDYPRVASLDGKLLDLQLGESPFAAYAGYSRGADDKVELYYRDWVETVDLNERGLLRRYGFFRYDVANSRSEKLFQWQSYMTPFAASASISPDGQHAVYVSEEGLMLVDPATGDRTRIADNPYALANPNQGQELALWAPSGERFLIHKYLSARSVVDALVAPLADPPEVTQLGVEGHLYRDWSPDGQRLCLGSIDIAVYDIATQDSTELLADLNLGSGVFVSGCSWSPDGRLAASYRAARGQPQTLVVFDADLHLIEQSEVNARVTAWLPDGSGILVTREEEEDSDAAPTENRPPVVSIYHPGSGDFDDVPFEAYQVFDVIPTP